MNLAKDGIISQSISKIMKQKFLLIFWGIVSISSCQIMETIPTNKIDFDFYDNAIPSSSILCNPKYVKLEQPCNDAIIKRIDKLLFIEDRIIIVDRQRNIIILFDKDGKYLYSSNNLIGKGKNEYIHFVDCAIDKEKKWLYVSCDSPFQLMVLNKNLKVEKCIKINELFDEISTDNNYLYALVHDLSDKDRFELRRYEKNNFNKPFNVLLRQERVISGVRGFGKVMCSDGKKTFVCMPFDNVIHIIENGKITNSYDINLKEKWFSYKDSKNLVGRYFFRKNEDVNWTIQNICASDSTLLFNTNLADVYRIDLRNNTGDSHTELINEKSFYNTTWLIPYGGIQKSIIRVIPPVAIRDAIDNHFINKEKISEPLLKSVDSCNYGDNLILEIFQIK